VVEYGILFVVLTVLSQTAVGYTIIFQDGLDFGGNCDNGETFGGNGPVDGFYVVTGPYGTNGTRGSSSKHAAISDACVNR